jgi:hypothetical protein
MTQVVTPSNLTEPVTRGQIAKVEDLVGAAVRKSGLPGACVQQLVHYHGAELTKKILQVLKGEALESTGIAAGNANVHAGMARDPKKALGMIPVMSSQYVCIREKPAASMPHGKPGPVTVTLFQLRHPVNSYEDLMGEYAARGLKPADPATFAIFCYTHGDILVEARYIATTWKDPEGMWCAVKVIYRFESGTSVSVEEVIQFNNWFFAGVPLDH